MRYSAGRSHAASAVNNNDTSLHKETTMKTQPDSTKARLTGFFLSVGVLSLSICILTMIFFLTYNRRYQQSVEQIMLFQNYSANLSETMDLLNTYTLKEDQSVYDESVLLAQQLRSGIAYLQDQRTSDLSMAREIRDIREMTETLFMRQQQLSDDMALYQSSGSEDFSTVTADYTELKRIHTAITRRSATLHKMLIDHLGEWNAQMNRKTRLYYLLFMLAFTGIVISVLWQIHGISRAVMDPIGRLTRKAQQIRQSGLADYHPQPALPKSGGDLEIRVLSDVFDDMVQAAALQFETLQENARIRHELEESRFKELQMQINPHFLFNTMNMIAEKAYFENAGETEELLSHAADMFRYSLDFSGKSVTLFKEIEALGSYVYIQEHRYGKRIRFIFDLDESFHSMEIPALTIQPLIENALIHGISMRTENALIQIRTCYDDSEETGRIIIEDNGAGMNPEKLQEIRALIQDYSSDSVKIGLGNVAQRLRLFFDGKARMLIDSEENKGTRVTLELPFKKKK